MEDTHPIFEIHDLDGTILRIVPLEFVVLNNFDKEKILLASIEIKYNDEKGYYTEARYKVELTNQDLENLKDKLLSHQKNLSAREEFWPTRDQYLTMQMEGDGLGHIKAKCLAHNIRAKTFAMEFDLDFDQSYLPVLIKQLEAIIQKLAIKL